MLQHVAWYWLWADINAGRLDPLEDICDWQGEEQLRAAVQK
jgi:hypothetical protein